MSAGSLVGLGVHTLTMAAIVLGVPIWPGGETREGVYPMDEVERHSQQWPFAGSQIRPEALGA